MVKVEARAQPKVPQLAILYATREGHTRRISSHVAEVAANAGWSTQMLDVAELGDAWSAMGYDAVVLAASVHAGHHQREMVQFAKKRQQELRSLPTALLSVSLSEVNAEDTTRSAEIRKQAAADVAHMLEQFYESTGFRPTSVKPVAGALLYTHYNFVIRYVMKRIAARAGGPTDTSRDYEFTDWQSLANFTSEFLHSALTMA